MRKSAKKLLSGVMAGLMVVSMAPILHWLLTLMSPAMLLQKKIM